MSASEFSAPSKRLIMSRLISVAWGTVVFFSGWCFVALGLLAMMDAFIPKSTIGEVSMSKEFLFGLGCVAFGLLLRRVGSLRLVPSLRES